LNPRTWVPKASALSLDHRSRWEKSYFLFSFRKHNWMLLLLLIKHSNLCKVLACSTAFFQLSPFCAIFFQLCIFILLISSKAPFSQRVLGLPIGLLDMGFHLLTIWRLTATLVIVPHR
jgi:hypothetical protein